MCQARIDRYCCTSWLHPDQIYVGFGCSGLHSPHILQLFLPWHPLISNSCGAGRGSLLPSEKRKVGWKHINGIKGSLEHPARELHRRSATQALWLKGLTAEDLVVLSGAHTIGFAHCHNFVSRLYNYRDTKQPDPAIDPRLLKALKMSCPHYGGNIDIVAPFDVTTPFLFDHAYYGNLEAKLGLLATDQGLFLDPRTKPVVQALAKDKNKFFQAFAAAMEKMGSIGVKRGGKHGEKRKDCSKHIS
jgi:hypothetical protein